MLVLAGERGLEHFFDFSNIPVLLVKARANLHLKLAEFFFLLVKFLIHLIKSLVHFTTGFHQEYEQHQSRCCDQHQLGLQGSLNLLALLVYWMC